jgi:hypothetical protein
VSGDGPGACQPVGVIMNKALLAAIACLSVTVPVPSRAGVSLEATIGGQQLGVTRAPGEGEPLAPMGDYGAALLLKGGLLELGFAASGTFDDGSLDRYDASVLGGLGLDVALVRLELLGELGVANLRSRDDLADATGGDSSFERFYGVRPGISARLPILPLRLGVWGLARWDLPGTEGVAYGMLARVGIDF